MTQPDRTTRSEFCGEEFCGLEPGQVAGGSGGSQSSGASVGKVTFNPFAIPRKSSSCIQFKQAAVNMVA